MTRRKIITSGSAISGGRGAEKRRFCNPQVSAPVSAPMRSLLPPQSFPKHLALRLLVPALSFSILISLAHATAAGARGWDHFWPSEADNRSARLTDETASDAVLAQSPEASSAGTPEKSLSQKTAPSQSESLPAEAEKKPSSPGENLEPGSDHAQSSILLPALKGGIGWQGLKERARLVGDADEKEPITIDGRVRHPVIFFSHVANRRWDIGPVFSLLIFVSAMLKIFLPELTAQATMRCRTNLYASLSSAFIYATILITLTRYAFHHEDLSPMGILIVGVLQLSFSIGACLGTNLFAENIYNFFTSKGQPAKLAPRVLIYTFCLIAVATLLTAISIIPNFGPLLRVGNRIVMLVAVLGLGGLVNLLSSRSKPQAQDSSGPV